MRDAVPGTPGGHDAGAAWMAGRARASRLPPRPRRRGPVTAELWPQQGQEDCRSGGVEPERGGVYPLPISAPARVPGVHRA